MIDPITKTEHTGERFSPTVTSPIEVNVNLRRYTAVLPRIADKTVLDIGCGSGLGTYLYSLVAKRVTAIDYSADALDYAQKYPHDRYKMAWRKWDVEREGIPPGEYDVAVALEVLEHIDDPHRLLLGLQKSAKELFFSVPLNSLKTSEWHKYDIRGVKDVVSLIEPHCAIEKYEVMDNLWVVGFGRMKKI